MSRRVVFTILVAVTVSMTVPAGAQEWSGPVAAGDGTPLATDVHLPAEDVRGGWC